MERLSIDFKGPLASKTENRYLFVAVDEYSRYPFAIPCKDMSSKTVICCLESIFSLCGVPNYIHSDRGASFVSLDVRRYLLDHGVATSNSSPYHPIGNGQVERYNAIIWKTVQLALATRKLSASDWETVLPLALHCVRSLISTSTNATPHERFFSFPRNSSMGMSLPSWLLTPGPVFLRNFVRHSKDDPLVQEVTLLHSNPKYANIRYPDGRESSVSLHDLAPCPISRNEQSSISEEEDDDDDDVDNQSVDQSLPLDEVTASPERASTSSTSTPTGTLRRSQRLHKEPERYGWTKDC